MPQYPLTHRFRYAIRQVHPAILQSETGKEEYMENLPNDIADCVRSLDFAWKAYKDVSAMPRTNETVQYQQSVIIAAKNRLIACLNEDIL